MAEPFPFTFSSPFPKVMFWWKWLVTFTISWNQPNLSFLQPCGYIYDVITDYWWGRVRCTNWDYWRGKENQWCTRQRMYHVRDGYPSSETHNGEKSNKRNRCNYAVMHSSEDIWQRWIIFSWTLLQRKKKIYVAKRNVKGSCDMDDMNRNSVMIWQCGGDICTAGYLWH